jgi:geranylgeranyl reductase family protein
LNTIGLATKSRLTKGPTVDLRGNQHLRKVERKQKALSDRDAIIIGAGPAGCEMAYRLASDGFDVLVVEKDKLDREKSCGGGIQIQELVEFGPLPDNVIERRIFGCRIHSPENKVFDKKIPRTDPYAVTVRRSVYDRYLQERASKAGAEFLSESSVKKISRRGPIVTIRLDNGDGPRFIKTRLLVNAAGSTASNLTKMLGIKDPGGEICVTYHHWLKPKRIENSLKDSIEFYYLKENPEGYVWIFPKKDILSVGIGATAESIQKNKIKLKELLTAFIETHPLASKKLKGAQIVRTDGGIIKLGMLPQLWAPSCIVLGDAAGLANIVHGGGIYHARKSALIASKHCRKFLKTGDQTCLKEYDRQCREFFENYEMRWDRKIRRIFWNPRTVDHVVEKARDDKQISEALFIIINSTRSHEVAYRIFEKKMLGVIYSELDKQADTYKNAINTRLREVFRKKTALHAYANEILLNNKAKRLRASLSILVSELFHGDKDVAINFSLVYELFHTASLVHDDIMDKAKKRRGKKTLHVKYGLTPAIITGDLMLARCHALIAQGADSPLVSKDQLLGLQRLLGESGEDCCLGQLQDIRMGEKKQYGSIKNYLKMIELKTGSLIEGAVKGGAVIAGASPDQTAIISRFGRNLGVAFQIVDDSLDLLGGSSANKSVMNDLKQGKATPMLIYSLKKANGEEKERILRATGNPAVTASMARDVVGIYRKYNAIAYAQELSLIYVEKAQKELAHFPADPARSKLDDILDVLRIWGMLGKS